MSPVLASLSAHLHQLEQDSSLSLAEIFTALCERCGLNATEIAADLGCQDPYALLGYMQVMESDLD